MADFKAPKISVEKSWKFTPQVLILIIIGVIIILGVLVFISLQKKEVPPPEIPLAPSPPKEKTTEEILKDLSVPEEKKEVVEEVPSEVIESLTAPPNTKSPPVSEEIIKNLSVPENK